MSVSETKAKLSEVTDKLSNISSSYFCGSCYHAFDSMITPPEWKSAIIHIHTALNEIKIAQEKLSSLCVDLTKGEKHE